MVYKYKSASSILLKMTRIKVDNQKFAVTIHELLFSIFVYEQIYLKIFPILLFVFEISALFIL